MIIKYKSVSAMLAFALLLLLVCHIYIVDGLKAKVEDRETIINELVNHCN